MGAMGSGHIAVNDAEVVALPKTDLMVINIGIGDLQLPRLKRQLDVYERYRIRALRVEYVPTSGMATAGNIAIAILPGTQLSGVKDAATIAKCQPLLLVPAWKAGSLRAGPNLDAQRFLHCGQNNDDGVACCIYVKPSAVDLGYVRVHYSIEFAFPKPF